MLWKSTKYGKTRVVPIVGRERAFLGSVIECGARQVLVRERGLPLVALIEPMQGLINCQGAVLQWTARGVFASWYGSPCEMGSEGTYEHKYTNEAMKIKTKSEHAYKFLEGVRSEAFRRGLGSCVALTVIWQQFPAWCGKDWIRKCLCGHILPNPPNSPGPAAPPATQSSNARQYPTSPPLQKLRQLFISGCSFFGVTEASLARRPEQANCRFVDG